MKLKFFGDSYDIVKKSLIAWLAEFGDWSAHPMFTEDVYREEVHKFSSFLNVHILSSEKLTRNTDRTSYFRQCSETGNLFLDPDTGVRLSACGGIKSINYVFGRELVEWSHARSKTLTLVFDQSYSRGRQGKDMQTKLRYFYSKNVHGFTYSSHAPFLVLSSNKRLIQQAKKTLLKVSGLPDSRIVTLNK